MSQEVALEGCKGCSAFNECGVAGTGKISLLHPSCWTDSGRPGFEHLIAANFETAAQVRKKPPFLGGGSFDRTRNE